MLNPFLDRHFTRNLLRAPSVGGQEEVVGGVPGRWSKHCQFLSTFKIRNIHVEVGGGQKRAKWVLGLLELIDAKGSTYMAVRLSDIRSKMA